MLDDRKRTVLRALIETYIASAEPVASRTLSRRSRLGVSPATIRNEMADLAELGYLEQPHTSAGRIPSDRGYRYYVDELMTPAVPEHRTRDTVRDALDPRAAEPGLLLRQAAQVLAGAARYVAVILGPQVQEATVRQVKLFPLSEGRALLVMATDAGFIEDRIIDVPAYLTAAELARVGEVLTAALVGRPLDALPRAPIVQLEDELGEARGVVADAIEALRTVLRPGGDDRVYVGGAIHMLSQPEFRDVERLRRVLTALESGETVRVALMGAAPSGDAAAVSIGGENPVPDLHLCSVVVATAEVDGRVVARVGIIGPTRMDYARTIPLVELVTETVQEVLERGRSL